MSNDINLAWVIPVDYTVLGARLEAFAENREAIAAFRLCRSHSPSPALQNMPLEIIDMIVNATLDVAYVERMKQWLQAKACSEMRCRFKDHYDTPEQLAEAMSVFTYIDPDSPTFQCSNNRHPHGTVQPCDSCRRHKIDVRMFRAKATSSIWLGSIGGPIDYFREYKQAFWHRFGVLPYFIPDPIRVSHWRTDFEKVEGMSYDGQLALLISTSGLQATRGESYSDVLYSHNDLVDAKEIKDPTSDDIAKPLQKAVDALRLNAGHTLIARAGTLWEFGFGKFAESDDEDDKDDESIALSSRKECLFCLECGGKHDSGASLTVREAQLRIIGTGALHVDDVDDDDVD